MKLSDWLSVVPAVQNAWTFAAFVVVLGVWLIVRSKNLS